MGEAHDFIIYLRDRLNEIHIILKSLIKEEELLQDTILVKSGLLLRRYSLRGSITANQVLELYQPLARTKALQQEVLYLITKVEKHLKALEKDYQAVSKDKLKLSLIFKEKMNNAFYLVTVASGRILQLKDAVEDHQADRVKKLLDSLGGIFNQILQFTDLVNQLAERMQAFEKNNYLEIPRVYGRAMSKQEEKTTLARQELVGSPKRQEGNLIAVFDAPPSVQAFINSLSAGAVRNYFSRLGAAGAVKIVYFQTKLRPANFGVPVPSRVTIGGGALALKEYKFPKGISVQVMN